MMDAKQMSRISWGTCYIAFVAIWYQYGERNMRIATWFNFGEGNYVIAKQKYRYCLYYFTPPPDIRATSFA